MSDPAWFVYLFALTDCSAFKVGFSCNPFQRIQAFCRRYYERFDVSQSLLLRLRSEADARAIEATLESELAAFRTDSPVWVPLEAGGQTEWFSAVELGRAGERLRSFSSAYTQSSALALADSLRDWLDAYRFFDVPLSSDDPAVREFAWSIARPFPRTQPRRTRAS